MTTLTTSPATIAQTVAALLATEEGATYDVIANTAKTSGGVCVAVKGYERIVSEADVLAETETFVSEHRSLFEEEGYYLGLWKHEGQVYFDIVEVLAREEAIIAGRERNEIAVFDLDAMEEITL